MLDALYCLAEAIYYESRSEPVEGQYAVGAVIINRAMLDGYPDGICEVVFQPHQFDGMKDRPGIDRDNVLELRAWDQALNISAYLLDTFEPEQFRATHFHTAEVRPAWSYNLEYLGRIGDHLFYREGE